MIVRAMSLLVVIYALGFILFSVTLGRPARDDAPRTDAVVVVTGGPGRIEHGVEVLARKQARRMLIAGADPSVTKADLIRRLGGRNRLIQCCVDLGSESVDTRSNAEEAQRWLARRGFKSLRLVTNDYHMRRTRFDFDRLLGNEYTIVSDSVPGDPSFTRLFVEYSKYVLRRISVLLEL